MRTIMLLGACWLLTQSCTQNQAQGLFQYNDNDPLAWTTASFMDTLNVSVSAVSFTATPQYPASALVAVDKTPAQKKPVIIFQHWGGGDKSFFRSEAIAFASKGFYCISLDAPWHWVTLKDTVDFFYNYPRFIQFSVVAIHRLIDSFSRNQAFDKDNIFYIGHSYGGTLGGLLAGVEPRIKAGVLMTGLASISRSMFSDTTGVWQKQWRADPPGFLRIANQLGQIEPENNIGKTKWKVFHQVGKKDEFVKSQQSQEYIRATPNPKVGYYDAGHLLNAEAEKDRMQWILQLSGKNQ